MDHLLLNVTLMMCIPLILGQINTKPYGATARDIFYLTDTNNDGHITRFEMNFTGYDTNGDQQISRSEFIEYIDEHFPQRHALSHALYDEYDEDKDHILNTNDFYHFLDVMDVNKNRVVNQAEWVNYWAPMLERLASLSS